MTPIFCQIYQIYQSLLAPHQQQLLVSIINFTVYQNLYLINYMLQTCSIYLYKFNVISRNISIPFYWDTSWDILRRTFPLVAETYLSDRQAYCNKQPSVQTLHILKCKIFNHPFHQYFYHIAWFWKYQLY